MKDIYNILNWKLLEGSHEFPGPDGGTCINEAAIVVAGFEYREVNGYSDLPSCFCPVVSSFALELNDNFSFVDRQKLIPYVVKLAGTKDTKRKAIQRLCVLKRFVLSVVDDDLLRGGIERKCKIYVSGLSCLPYEWPCEIWEIVSYLTRVLGGYRDLDYDNVIKILDDMINIGNRAPEIEVNLIKGRVESIKSKARVLENTY